MKKDKKLAILKGQHLKKALEWYNMKPVDITRNGKRTESQVSDWINGKVSPSSDSLQDIIDEYLHSVRLNYLLGYDEYMTERDLEKALSEESSIKSNSTIQLLESSLREVCYREGIEVPELNNIPELVFLQSQLEDYADSLMWNYVIHRDKSHVWSFLDNIPNKDTKKGD